MKTLSSISLLVLLAGSASAQVGGIGSLASGFVHTPLGGAEFCPVVERRLPIRNIGSSGQDGVDITFHTAQGGQVAINARSLVQATATPGSEIKIRHRGWDGLIYGTHRFVSQGSTGGVLCELDCSGLSTQAVRVECRDALGNVLAEFVEQGTTVRCVNQATYQPNEACDWSIGCGKASFSDLSFMCRLDKASPVLFLRAGEPPLSVSGAVEIVCRPICIVAPCPGDWTGLESMQVTYSGITVGNQDTDCDDQDCDNAALDWSWGLSQSSGSTPSGWTGGRVLVHAGSGGGGGGGGAGGLLSEEPADMDGDGIPDLAFHYTNSGALSGTAAVEGTTVEFEHPPMDCSLRHTKTGHVTLLKMYDDGGQEMRCASQTTPDGSTLLSPDFSSLGTNQVLVTAYDGGGTPVSSFIFVSNLPMNPYVILTDGICPPGSTPMYIRHGAVLFFIGCNYNYDLVAPGGGTISGVHSISMEPVGALSVMGPTRGITLACDGDITAGDFRILPPAGPTCDTIDFNGDGLMPDTADIDDFLSVFSGGPCSTGTCNDIDFNNDDLYPDSLDIDSMLSVFSGGACL